MAHRRLREAVDEKLKRLRRERLASQVDRYCDEGVADEDPGLIECQALGRRRSTNVWELKEQATAEAYRRQPDSVMDAYVDPRTWERPARRSRRR